MNKCLENLLYARARRDGPGAEETEALLKTPAVKELEGLITFYKDQCFHATLSAGHWRRFALAAGAAPYDTVEFASRQADQHDRVVTYATAIVNRLTVRLAMLQRIAL